MSNIFAMLWSNFTNKPIMRTIDSLRFTIKQERYYDVDILSISVNKTLAEVSNVLGGISWYEQARSRKDALQKKVSLSIPNIREIITKGWNSNNADFGCDFTLWSPQKDIEVGFRIGVEESCKVIGNNIFVALPLLRLDVKSNIVNEVKNIVFTHWAVTDFEVIYNQ